MDYSCIFDESEVSLAKKRTSQPILFFDGKSSPKALICLVSELTFILTLAGVD